MQPHDSRGIWRCRFELEFPMHPRRKDSLAIAEYEGIGGEVELIDEICFDERVHEQDSARVSRGQKSEALMSAQASRVYTGEVVFLHPHLDEMTRTASVRMAVANPDGLLRGTRGNGAGVELNRNFPTRDWRAEPVAHRATLDAPREGLLSPGPEPGSEPETRSLIALIEGLGPATVVYVSCNPQALAADLGAVARLNYRIRSLQPVDMFPHTAHIETVAVLTRT